MTLMIAEDMHGQPVASPDLFFRTNEQRARDAQTMALLPRQFYGTVLELGCGKGALARYLALRSDSYLGLDTSGDAVARARELALPGSGQDFRVGGLDDVSGGPFDLVVVSDLLGEMSAAEIAQLAAAVQRVAPEADLVSVRQIARGEDLAGGRASAALAAQLDWPLTATHVGKGFRIDVFAAGEGVLAD